MKQFEKKLIMFIDTLNKHNATIHASKPNRKLLKLAKWLAKQPEYQKPLEFTNIQAVYCR
jgi:hypothetical protein